MNISSTYSTWTMKSTALPRGQTGRYNGNDFIDGYQGNDQLKGGSGFDTFFFALFDGRDIIKDFSGSTTPSC